MKAKTKHLADQITQALGPIFRANPDYKTIIEAIALTVARVAQSTPNKGREYNELDAIVTMALEALTQFLNEEEALLEAKQSTLAKGIDEFTEMARSDESDKDLRDYYQDRITLENMAARKAQRDGPKNGLAAYNGGVSPEARAEAERFAGQDHAEVVDGYNLDEEIARFERENQDLRPNCCDPSYNPDGPRAYTP